VSGHAAGARIRKGAYVVFKDVARDEGLVDTRVFVCFEVLQGIFRDALMLRSICIIPRKLANHPVTPGEMRKESFIRTFARRHGGLGDGKW
jgi:hypothetical protein